MQVGEPMDFQVPIHVHTVFIALFGEPVGGASDYVSC